MALTPSNSSRGFKRFLLNCSYAAIGNDHAKCAINDLRCLDLVASPVRALILFKFIEVLIHPRQENAEFLVGCGTKVNGLIADRIAVHEVVDRSR
jgi:hypothetical protein